MDSWFWQRLMVWTYTYDIDNTHGIDLNSWYSIGTPESQTYKRAECYPYAKLFLMVLVTGLGPSPQFSPQCQRILPCCTVCLVWLALGAREITYGGRGGGLDLVCKIPKLKTKL